MRRYGVDCVIDAGANRGQYARMLRDLGYQGEIHSFEPLQSAFAELETLARNDAGWFCYRCALGGNREQRSINVAREEVFSSFLQPTAYSERKFKQESRIARAETVEIRRIDEVLAGVLEGKRAHLKMDTQGFDLEVFSGVGAALDYVVSLQSEISMRQIYAGMPDYIQSLSAYKNAGFSISGLFPVSRDKQDLTLIEMDCVMVRIQPANVISADKGDSPV